MTTANPLTGMPPSLQENMSKVKTGHPKGLYVLFFTEMWERCSYYGMRALLVLYMTQHLLVDPARAKTVLGYHAFESLLFLIFGQLNVQQISSQIYGLYTAFVYLTPLIGGFIADRWWGQHRSVYLGGILMATGQFLLASEHLFLVGLAFLILGNGFFKPNISTQVGNLYAAGDSRRDSAFMIFYMGVNLGAFLSPLICGTLGQKVGWNYGFAAAGIGMVLGLVVYHFGRHLVPHETPSQRQAKVAAAVGGLTAAEWKRIGVICLLCFLNIVFWGIYEQQGNTLQLWADGQTDWNLLGWEMPSTWYQSFNPAFIFIFTPLIVALWKRQAARGREPSTVAKMGMGCVLLGLGYVIMVFAARAFTGDKQNLMWLVTSTWVFTMGELYLSPVGLSMITKVAPARTVSTMMGVWYLSSFFGNYAAGFFGSFYSVMTKVHFFGLLAIAGIIVGCVFFLIRRPVVRVMQTKM